MSVRNVLKMILDASNGSPPTMLNLVNVRHDGPGVMKIVVNDRVATVVCSMVKLSDEMILNVAVDNVVSASVGCNACGWSGVAWGKPCPSCDGVGFTSPAMRVPARPRRSIAAIIAALPQFDAEQLDAIADALVTAREEVS